MTKLIGTVGGFAAVAAAATGVVFFVRSKRKRDKRSRWQMAKSSAISWSRTAANGAGTAAERVVGRA